MLDNNGQDSDATGTYIQTNTLGKRFKSIYQKINGPKSGIENINDPITTLKQRTQLAKQIIDNILIKYGLY